MKRLTGVSAALVLALVLAAAAGSALAENPHNPGPSPGNSGNAPGQQKKDQDPAATTTTTAATPAAQPAQAGPGKSDSAPGQQKKSTAQTATTQKQSPATDAKSSHTAADGSKQYGNGKSALQIAKQTKSSITINDLSEPGNSGKHKVTICHNGHLITVDVHALKAHARHLGGSDVIPATSAAQCNTAASTPQGTTQTQSAVCGSVTTTSTSTKVQRGHAYGRLKHGKPLHTKTVTKTETTPTGQVCTSSTGQNSTVVSSIVTIFGASGNGSSGTTGGANGSSTSGVSGGTAGSGVGAGAAGGVAGISATLGSNQPRGGVLGIAATRVKGALPFTGLALWLPLLIGASLLIGGVALVRRSRELAHRDLR